MLHRCVAAYIWPCKHYTSKSQYWQRCTGEWSIAAAAGTAGELGCRACHALLTLISFAGGNAVACAAAVATIEVRAAPVTESGPNANNSIQAAKHTTFMLPRVSGTPCKWRQLENSLPVFHPQSFYWYLIKCYTSGPWGLSSCMLAGGGWYCWLCQTSNGAAMLTGCCCHGSPTDLCTLAAAMLLQAIESEGMLDNAKQRGVQLMTGLVRLADK